MRSTLRPRCALLSLGVAVLLAGCGPARQDRTVHFSPQGDAVTFQHDDEGVFVTGKDGKPQKVYQPGPEVLVTSSPLWCPAGKRLLFATARDASGQPPPRRPLDPDPAGDLYRRRAVIYTCWLRDEAKPGEEVKPRALFEAACDHPGYVAANLAVRWHPDGGRVLFVKQVGTPHGLFEYDLKTGTQRQAFPHAAEALAFDWSPDGEHLACVLGHAGRNGAHDGVWVGRPGGAWWQVPESGALAWAPLPSLLESVRATLPAWTADGARFAFVSWHPGAKTEDPGRHLLRTAAPVARAVKTLAEGEQPFRDLHWAPDGKRLGVVRGKDTGDLLLTTTDGGLSQPLNRRPVRQFAGWDAAGERLAYVVPDRVPRADGENWAFLFVPDALARDAVLLAPGPGDGPGDEVFSGMRVTFPNWSPKEAKLSVWFTFAPTHRSVLSWLLGQFVPGLRRGDPAALFDPKGGGVRWLAVNGREKEQVGHYCLLKRRYAEAWRWYEEAAKKAPPAAAAGQAGEAEELLSPRDVTFFRYYCLTKLGREAEARARLEEFRRRYRPRPPAANNAPQAADELRRMLDASPVGAALVRDLYAAEVFLSLDAADDGEAFFRAAAASAETDADRLSGALVLSQMLLLKKDHAGYARQITETVLPLLFKVWKPQAGASAWDASGPQQPLFWAAGLTLLPLFDATFVAGLPEEQVRGMAARWQELRGQAGDDATRLAADLFLEAAYARLGNEGARREAAKRLESNPARAALMPEGAAGVIRAVREAPALVEQLRTLFGR